MRWGLKHTWSYARKEVRNEVRFNLRHASDGQHDDFSALPVHPHVRGGSRYDESEVAEMMGTAIAILIGLCLLLLGVVAFLLCLVQECERREKNWYTPVDVTPVDWDYTREKGWVDGDYEQQEKEGE